jgi:uncharacterized protein (TIGR02001 family)
MTKHHLAAVLLAAAIAPAALAQDAPPYTLTANVNLVSDYYFRGLTQTWGKPAIQGGFDFAHASGFYAGVWGSNVSGKQFAGGSMELDLYGGYNFKIGEDFTLGAGAIYYYYPGADTDRHTRPQQGHGGSSGRTHFLTQHRGVPQPWQATERRRTPSTATIPRKGDHEIRNRDHQAVQA